MSAASGAQAPADTNEVEQRVLAQMSQSPSMRPEQDQAVVLTGTSLQISSDLTYERWVHVGCQLSGVVDSSSWWLGDWLVFGKRQYGDRYQRAIRAAGLRYQTLRNYAWVARRFPVPDRRARLSFQHHAEVASLPVPLREWWLDRAESESWTTKQLRRQIKDGHPSELSEERRVSLLPRFPVTDDRLNWWRRAADQSGANFLNWMTETLDQAAKEALDEG